MAIWMHVVGAVDLIVLVWLVYSLLPDVIRYIRINRM